MAEAPAAPARVAASLRAQGAALKKAGKPQQALGAYRKALAAAPGHARTLFEIAALLYDLGRNEAAVAYWRRSVELDPTHSAAFHNLAAGLRKLRRREEAVAMFRKAIALAPQRPDSYANLAAVYRDDGEHEPALAVYQEMLAAIPGSPDALAGIATVYEAQGRVQEAHDVLRPLVEAGTRNQAVVLAYALVCHRLPEPSPKAAAFLEGQLARDDLPVPERRKVTFGLANLYDKLGRHEAAFARFSEVHRLERANEDARRANIANLARQSRIYSATRLAHLPRAQPASALPLFIVGMPRSGTTLVEQILSSHPQVFGAGELTEIGKLATSRLDTGVDFPECLDVLTREDASRLAEGYLAHLRKLAPPEALRVTDKMPLNFIHLGLIEILFPGARVVHCARHALDTCLSIYCNEFIDALAFTKDLETLGRYYVQYRALMRHWKSVLRIPMFEVRYEELVARPEEVSRALVGFCGLPWHDACLRFHETRRKVGTPSYHQVRQPLYSRSVARYRPYEPFLGPLKAALGEYADGR